MVLFSYSFRIKSLFNEHLLKISDTNRIESVLNFLPINLFN